MAFYYTFIQLISGNPIRLPEYLIRIISLRGIESMWFLPSIFFSSLLLALVLRFGKKAHYAAAAFSVTVIVYMAAFTGNMPTDHMARMLIVWSVGFLFEYIGLLIEKYTIIERTNVYFGLILAAAGIVLAELNGPIGIAALEFQKGLLTVINAVVTSIAVLSVFAFIDRNKSPGLRFVLYAGRNSIVILCTNNILIEIIRLLDYKITDNVLLKLGISGSFILAAVIMLLEIPLMILSHTRLRILFGRK